MTILKDAKEVLYMNKRFRVIRVYNSEYEGYYGMKGNPMSHGCSGGVWLIDVTRGINGYEEPCSWTK
ncbi:hypothetical protein ABIC37_005139 [Priestia megaterium]